MSSGDTWGERAATPQELLEAALSYTKRGWRVVPLYTPTEDGCSCQKGKDCPEKSRGKHPRIARWPDRASSNEEQVRAWWAAWPHANIGIVTGNGLGVIDVDPRNNGDDSLVDLQKKYGRLPETVEALTGSVEDGTRGHHVYGKVPEGTASLELEEGVEFKADGGHYVVAPPSLHRSGRPYEWEDEFRPENTPLASFPEWVTRQRGSKSKSNTKGPSAPVASPRTDGSGDPYSLGVLNRLLRDDLGSKKPNVPNGRNEALNWAAYRLGQFVGAGRLDEELVRRELSAAATYLGLGTEEVERTLDSGLEDGKQEPCYKGLDSRDQETLNHIRQWEALILDTDWKGMGGATERDIALAFAKLAKAKGKTTVDYAQLDIALDAGVSQPTVGRKDGPLKRLLKKGYLKKERKDRRATEAATFSLTFPGGEPPFRAGGSQGSLPVLSYKGTEVPVITHQSNSGQKRVITPTPPVEHDLWRWGGALGKTKRHVYSVLLSRPAWKVSELEEELHRKPKTIRNHLNDLADLPVPLARKEGHHWSAIPRTAEELDRLAVLLNVAGKGEEDSRKYELRRDLHRRALGEHQSSQEPLRGARVPVVGSETLQEDVFQGGVRSRARKVAGILGAGSSGGPNEEHEVDEEPGVSLNGHREREEPLNLGSLAGVASCR